MDGRNPLRTTEETLECVDSPENTNKLWFPMVSKWCERISSVHSSVLPFARGIVRKASQRKASHLNVIRTCHTRADDG